MAATKKRTNPILAALTTSALALPGLNVKADSAPEEASVGYRFYVYQEGDAPVDKLSSGSPERYSIYVNQFQLLAPINESVSINFNYIQESMSGASPVGTEAGDGGESQLIMSAASIKESRRDVSSTVRWYAENGNLGMSVGVSNENDYDATYGGIDVERHFNKKNTSVKLASSVSSDTLSPTGRVDEQSKQFTQSKQSVSIVASITQLVSAQAMLQTGFGTTQLSGYLTDPYKALEGDVRPESKNQYTWSAGARIFFAAQDAAMHIGYRYYTDDWSINSHAVKLSWYQNIKYDIQLIPSLRYYVQTEAEFYDRYFTTARSDGFFSSDYRLSSYGAISAKLKYVQTLKRFSYTATIEWYDSSASYSYRNISFESPGLVNYVMFTTGLNFNF